VLLPHDLLSQLTIEVEVGAVVLRAEPTTESKRQRQRPQTISPGLEVLIVGNTEGLGREIKNLIREIPDACRLDDPRLNSPMEHLLPDRLQHGVSLRLTLEPSQQVLLRPSKNLLVLRWLDLGFSLKDELLEELPDVQTLCPSWFVLLHPGTIAALGRLTSRRPPPRPSRIRVNSRRPRISKIVTISPERAREASRISSHSLRETVNSGYFTLRFKKRGQDLHLRPPGYEPGTLLAAPPRTDPGGI
jgi:hypothetical protein